MSQSLISLRYDVTWNGYVIWIWLIVECDLAIICISVPVLRVLFKRIFPGRSEKTLHQKTQPTRAETPPKPQVKQGANSFTSLIQEGKIVRTDGIEMYSRPADTYRPEGEFRNETPNGERRWGKRDPYDIDDMDRYTRRDPMSRV
jgi:hypothetical protein